MFYNGCISFTGFEFQRRTEPSNELEVNIVQSTEKLTTLKQAPEVRIIFNLVPVVAS
jgi:hypothetical protein